MGAKRRPKLRRCVVCRKSTDKAGLLRFVVQGARLVWDQSGALPGRGAYIHSTLACWSKMSEAGMWEHALRLQKGTLPKDSVVEAARSARVKLEGAVKVEVPVAKVRL